MHFKSAAGLVLLAGLASASPKAKRSQCVPNQCYSAVTSQGSLASEDCSSFLQTTVSQCPATTTVYATSTFVAPTSFATLTDVIDETEVYTVIETEESNVATIEDTVTFIQPTEVDVINIIVTAVTVTAFDKREYKTQPDLQPTPVFRRFITASNCTATTSSATNIPSYASACSNSAQYSSACSRFGVSASTTTLSQSISTITSTSTEFSTPLATIIVTAENDVTEIETETDFVPVTFETTDATVIVQSAFTLTSSIVIPTTVVVSPPLCTGYQFVAESSDISGRYVAANGPANPNVATYAFVEFNDALDAHNWIIGLDGSVMDPKGLFTWYSNGANAYYILELTQSAQGVIAPDRISCSIVPGGASTPGAIGTLSCEITNISKNINICPSSTGMYLILATDAEAAANNCQEVILGVIPVAFAC